MKLKHISPILTPLILLSVFFFAQSVLPQNAQAQTLLAQNMQDGIGTVISLQAGVFALRDGQEVPLELKSLIQEKDTIITNRTGKVQIILNDDTTLALAPNSRLLMEEFSMEAKSPIIRTNLSQGLVRSITGVIVEQNPDGFSMTTPDASIAIRGTIFAVEYKNDSTSTYVFNTKKQVLVNGLEIPSGSQYSTLSGDIIPITQDTFKEINEQTNISVSVQISQSNTANTDDNKNTNDTNDTNDTDDTDDANNTGDNFNDNAFADNDNDLSNDFDDNDDFGNDDFGNDFDDGNGFDDSNGYTAVVSGKIVAGEHNVIGGSFSFGANLFTGNISDAKMHIDSSGIYTDYNFDNGTGTVVGGTAVDIDFENGKWENSSTGGTDATGTLTGDLGANLDFNGEFEAISDGESPGDPLEGNVTGTGNLVIN